MVEQLEEWKDVVGYEGLYQVSSLAKIKSKYKLRKQLKNGILVKRYESVRQASRENGWSCGAISECANGIYKTMYGYEWRYE